MGIKYSELPVASSLQGTDQIAILDVDVDILKRIDASKVIDTRQIPTTTNADHEVLFSNSANNTEENGPTRKNTNLKFNPSTGNLQTTQLNGVTVGTNPKFTDTNNAVTQTATTGNANYEVLFSNTADNVTRTEGARKSADLRYNPSTGNLQATQLNGVAIGSAPKFTDAAVLQVPTSGDGNYEVLFSNSATNTQETSGARKNSNLKFNPSTGNLQATQLNGVTIGSAPKFTDTTYSVTSKTAAGLAPQLPNETATTKYLRQDGTWQVPPGGVIPSAYCETAAGTAAKVATCSGYVLTAKTYIQVIITTANTAASALTLNINGKGAKTIYINGVASSGSNYTLPAGSYLVYYDSVYYFRTDGVMTGDITGSATKINGLSISLVT